ncbi:hypothetical protein RFI_03825 [Reticulomyxa filosa]|uniref:Uncharacterized protein n=1 Tax=Reticulomyxa filosa TaxID=46433 RepID=X6P587_RETFI|nr:hypothetical protein RFI_03825 [Reticulomyxa filosa]|eukprot:ETO33283.1 hypothetical protein RFI_03825 [Reticulomyxa filosa]
MVSEWDYSYHQSKWNYGNVDIAYPYLNNDFLQHLNDENSYNGHYTVFRKAPPSGNLLQFKIILQNKPHIGINDLCNDIIKLINEREYETLLQGGATFSLRISQDNLKEIIINNNLLYWAASRNVMIIVDENTNKKRFDEGWYLLPFLITRIFLLFEICVRLRSFIRLPKDTTFK